MRTRRPFRLQRVAAVVTLVLVAGHGLPAATIEPIVTPAKRVEGLERARSLLAVKPVPEIKSNPFFSLTFNEVRLGSPSPEASADGTTVGTPVVPVGSKSNRDLLQSIATSLKPRYLEMGGQSMLFFGQKRVKAGGVLSITFEGTEYTLEVTAIDRTNFTLRLNREEFTRPIK